MYHRVLTYRDGDYDPAASSTVPMLWEEAKAFAKARVAEGLECFIVVTDGPNGEIARLGEDIRVVPQFKPD